MSWNRCVALVALVGGCQQEVPFVAAPPAQELGAPQLLEPETQTDVILQAAIPSTDILWMIDNSGSMNCIVGCHSGGDPSDFVKVTEEFDTFMGLLDGSGIDYHIGVITADTTEEGRLVEYGGIRYIDDRTPNPVDVFTDLALSVGTSGGELEEGLGTTFLARENQPDNGGFFRRDSALHTIAFSNEPDQTKPDLITQREFVTWYGALATTKEERTFSSIVCLDVTHEACRSPGLGYIQSTEEIGGVIADITADDYGSLVEQLALQAVAQRAEFFLSEMPVPETIEVLVDIAGGARVNLPPYVIDPETEEATGEWLWVPVRNSIRLEGDFRPPPLSRMEITYTVAGDVQPPVQGEGEGEDEGDGQE